MLFIAWWWVSANSHSRQASQHSSSFSQRVKDGLLQNSICTGSIVKIKITWYILWNRITQCIWDTHLILTSYKSKYIVLVWRTFSVVFRYGIYKWNIVRNFFVSVVQYYFLEDIWKDITKNASWNVQCEYNNIQYYFYWLNYESLHFTHLSVMHFGKRSTTKTSMK